MKSIARLMALALIVAMSACSDYDAYNNTALTQEQALEEYNNNFVMRYGRPALSHSWGFDTPVATRAVDARPAQGNDACWLDIDDAQLPALYKDVPADAFDLTTPDYWAAGFTYWDCKVNGQPASALVVPAGKELSSNTPNTIQFATDVFVAGTLNLDNINFAGHPTFYILDGGTLNYNAESALVAGATIINHGTLNINARNFFVQPTATLYSDRDIIVEGLLQSEGMLYTTGGIKAQKLDLVGIKKDVWDNAAGGMVTGYSTLYAEGDITVEHDFMTGAKAYVGGDLTCGVFNPYAGSVTHIIGNLTLTDEQSSIGTNQTTLCVEGTFQGRTVTIDCEASIHIGCKMYANSRLNIHNDCNIITNYIYAPETHITQGTVTLPHGGYADLGDFYLEDVSTTKFRSTGTATINAKRFCIGEQYSLGPDYTDDGTPVIDGYNIFYTNLYIHGNVPVDQFGDQALAGNNNTNRIDGYNAIDPGDACEHQPNPLLNIPGADYPASQTKRIMCEDLGGTNDFDFNDLVFDATWPVDGDTHRVKVIVRAAGGTIPIYINGMDIHARFGVPTTTPVNVNAAGGADDLPALDPIYINLDHTRQYTTWSQAIFDIPILVGSPNSDGLNVYRLHDRNATNVPRAFAVPTTVVWTKEHKAINSAYAAFTQWVEDEYRATDWYATVTAPELTYNSLGHTTANNSNGSNGSNNSNNSNTSNSSNDSNSSDNSSSSSDSTPSSDPQGTYTDTFALTLSAPSGDKADGWRDLYTVATQAHVAIDPTATYTITFNQTYNEILFFQQGADGTWERIHALDGNQHLTLTLTAAEVQHLIDGNIRIASTGIAAINTITITKN